MIHCLKPHSLTYTMLNKVMVYMQQLLRNPPRKLPISVKLHWG